MISSEERAWMCACMKQGHDVRMKRADTRPASSLKGSSTVGVGLPLYRCCRRYRPLSALVGLAWIPTGQPRVALFSRQSLVYRLSGCVNTMEDTKWATPSWQPSGQPSAVGRRRNGPMASQMSCSLHLLHAQLKRVYMMRKLVCLVDALYERT